MSVSSAESGTSASRKAGQKGREGGRREGRKRADGWRGGRGRGTKVGTERARAQQWSTSHPTPRPPRLHRSPSSPLEENTVFVPFLSKFQLLGQDSMTAFAALRAKKRYRLHVHMWCHGCWGRRGGKQNVLFPKNLCTRGAAVSYLHQT